MCFISFPDVPLILKREGLKGDSFVTFIPVQHLLSAELSCRAEVQLQGERVFPRGDGLRATLPFSYLARIPSLCC